MFGRLSATNESTEALLVDIKETGLEVCALVIYRDQNAGQTHMKLGGAFQMFVNNRNYSKLHLRRNSEQFEVPECLLSFGAESFVCSLLSSNLNTKIY